MNRRAGSRVGRRGVALLAALAALAANGAGRAAPGEEKPVALPPFIVEEASRGPPWRYTEAMGYEILSRCTDTVTRRVVEAHHQLHELLAEILPPQFQVTMSVPRALILYDEELQPAASQEVIARMIRSSPPPVDDGFPAAPGRLNITRAGTTQRYRFLPNLRLWDHDGMAIFMIVRGDDIDADRLALTQDYVAFMLKSRLPALPPWFVQGVLALHEEVSYGGGRLTLGPMAWISPPHTDRLKKDPKSAPGVLPLADFLASRLPVLPADSGIEPLKAWQAQALLFVRWGLDPAGGARRAAFWRFAERSAIEGVSEELFRDCFDLDYETAQAQLNAYLPSAVRRTIQFRPKRVPPLPPLALRNASDGQLARIKGDWERLEISYVQSISPDLAGKYLEQARRTLKRGYDRGERDPRLLAVLGLCESDAGNDAGAREFLEAGMRLGPMRPRALYELARLRLAEFRASPAGRDGRLSVPQLADVLRPLFVARTEAPPLPEVYELIAAAWAAADATPTRAHLAVLDEGARFFPRRSDLLLRAAELYLKHGYHDLAATFIAAGERGANDEATRERVAVLQRQLGPPQQPEPLKVER